MKYASWKDLSPEIQESLLEIERARLLNVRNQIIKEFGIEYADKLWYTKLDYINSWTYPSGFLFSICEKCGTPTELMELLSDKPAPCESRDVIWKCKCGKLHYENV